MRSDLTKKGQTTRRRIIDAAFRLFRENGFDEVSTTRICEEAGVSNGSLFHYFPEKTDILYAFVEDESEEMTAMAPTLDAESADIALDRLVDWQAAYYQTKGLDFIAHFHSHLISSRRGEEFEYSFVPVTERIIERGQYEGVFRSGIEPRFAAELLFDRILSLVTYGTWPDDSDEVTIADMIVEQYRKFFDQVLST